MPFVNHKVKVDADATILWDMMIDKIRHPDKYVPGIVRVEVLEEYHPLAIERRMYHESGQEIRERILADPLTKTVIFKSVADPVYSGYVINMVFEELDGVYLDYTMHWTPHPGHSESRPDAFYQDLITNAVLHAKQLAEAAEYQG